MNFITDTHALLWHFTNSPKISQRAKGIFAKCEKGECVIFIPSIVIAECLSIFDKKKIIFDFKALLIALEKAKTMSLSPLTIKYFSR